MNTEADNEGQGEATDAGEVRWRVPEERWVYHWRCTRRDLGSTRLRLVVIGNIVLAVVYLFIWASGASGLGLVGEIICAVLLSGSLIFLLLEWFAAKLPSREPPWIVIRHDGVLETGGDGPEVFVAWPWVRQLRILRDPERSDYRSLELQVQSGAEWSRDYETYRLPLPSSEDASSGAVSEGDVWAAIGRALAHNGIEWTQPDEKAAAVVHLSPPGERAQSLPKRHE
jgi:hypothetical protein